MIAADREALRETISGALNQAMEAMFFDAAEPIEECDCAGRAEMVTVCLWFHDAMDGEFLLSTPLPTALALAASFLGLDTNEMDRSHAEQIVCELANIVCGSALSRLEPSSELRLSPPLVTPRLCNGDNDAIYQHYRLLDGCLAVSLHIDSM